MSKTDDTAVSDQGAVAEATVANSVKVHWNDHDWEFPPSLDDCDILTLQAWEDGKALKFVERALRERNPAQWQRFLKGGRRTGGDAAEFMKVIFRDGWGTDLGE
jgi:hypothetical protein